MAAERIPMRKLREALPLRLAGGYVNSRGLSRLQPSGCARCSPRGRRRRRWRCSRGRCKGSETGRLGRNDTSLARTALQVPVTTTRRCCFQASYPIRATTADDRPDRVSVARRVRPRARCVSRGGRRDGPPRPVIISWRRAADRRHGSGANGRRRSDRRASRCALSPARRPCAPGDRRRNPSGRLRTDA